MKQTPSCAAALLAVLCCGACGHDDAQRTAVPAPDSSSASVATAGLVRIPWQPFADTNGGRPFDYGVGIVAIGTGIDTLARAYPVTDTLLFRAAPSGDAAIAGALLVERAEMGAWAYVVLAPSGLRPNMLEYAYEVSGVPIDSVDATGNWVRGLIGIDAANAMLRGWADVRTRGTEKLMWAEHLTQQRPDILDTARTLLFATRADAEAGRSGVAVPPRPHTITVLETSGSFMRVRVQWPFEECNGPDSTKRNDREYWIRYIDQRGRPQVFYASRGC